MSIIANERAKFQVKCLIDEIGAVGSEINDWEERFLYSVAQQLEDNPNKELSEKQQAVIEKIWRKQDGREET